MSNILIIGATSSVAQACMEQWRDGQSRYFLLARNAQKLQHIAERLGPQCVGQYSFDFNHQAQWPAALEALQTQMPHIDRVLLAQGVLPDQIETENDIARVKQCFEDNCFNPIAFVQKLLPLLQQHGGGQMIVISSVAGDRGRPRNFTYGAAKGALNLYLQGVRSVYYRSGVELFSIKLGPVISPMTETHEKNFSFSTPERVAQIIDQCLRHGPGEYYVPGYWRWVMLVVRNLPEALFQRLHFLSDR